MPAPCARAEQFKKLASIRIVARHSAEKQELEFSFRRQRVEGADEGILIFAQANVADAQNDRRAFWIYFRLDGKKIRVHGVGHDPGFFCETGHGGARAIRGVYE